MSDPTVTDPALLAHDADLATPLARVAYEEGMLLGLEATRAEQDYHRRRLLRHQAWLHGAGTIAGLHVSVADGAAGSAVLTVHAGLGIDGLGREIQLTERYCLDLARWFQVQAPQLTDSIAAEDGTHRLYLRLTARHRPVPRQLGPVLAAEANAGTDAVLPGRVGDGVQLELLGDVGPSASWEPPLPAPTEAERLRRIQQMEAAPPWRRLLDARAPATPTASETDFLDSLGGVPEEQEQVRAQLRRLNWLDRTLPAPAPTVDGSEPDESELAPLARVLLATVVIELGEPSLPTVTAATTAVNNLVRPFISASSAV